MSVSVHFYNAMHWLLTQQKNTFPKVLFRPAARYNCLVWSVWSLAIFSLLCLHLVDNLLVTGLCLSRSGPPEAHSQNIVVFFKTIYNPFI